MEQRTSEYGSIPLGAFLTAVRSITIPVEYVREDNGHWSCWTKHDIPGTIQTYGVGNTFDEAVDDYVDALKEIAECIYEDDLPEDDISVEWLAKIMMSSKEELKKCLFETSARHQSGKSSTKDSNKHRRKNHDRLRNCNVANMGRNKS